MNLFQVTKKQPSGLELKTFTGNPVTFTPTYSEALPAPFNSINLKATIVASGGGGTPSTPIPIVGYSEVKETRCGKNLWTFENSYSRESMGYLINNQPFFIKKGTYTFSYKTAKTSGAIAFSVKDSNGDSLAMINILNGTNKGSFTLNEDGYMLAFYTNEGGTFEDFQVEIGSQATDFEPYNSQLITLALGQTVYGGRIYFDNGWKLTCTEKYKNTFVRGSIDSSGKLYYVGASHDGKTYDSQTVADILCNALPVDTLEGLRISQAKGICFFNTGYYVGGYVGDEAALDALLQTLEVVYPLTTPFTIELSSSEMLDAVVGINNVFSDCGGDVEVQCLI